MEPIQVCKSCNKKFEIKIHRYPCRADEKRTTIISCPYCGASCGVINLAEDEELYENKLDDKNKK